jgi:hypothetical protein
VRPPSSARDVLAVSADYLWTSMTSAPPRSPIGLRLTSRQPPQPTNHQQYLGVTGRAGTDPGDGPGAHWAPRPLAAGESGRPRARSILLSDITSRVVPLTLLPGASAIAPRPSPRPGQSGPTVGRRGRCGGPLMTTWPACTNSSADVGGRCLEQPSGAGNVRACFELFCHLCGPGVGLQCG